MKQNDIPLVCGSIIFFLLFAIGSSVMIWHKSDEIKSIKTHVGFIESEITIINNNIAELSHSSSSEQSSVQDEWTDNDMGFADEYEQSK